MKRSPEGDIIYSPSDLIRYLRSPFLAWMDRYHFERPGELTPDEAAAQQELIAEAGNEHERAYLEDLRKEVPGLVTIVTKGRSFADCAAETRAAVLAKSPVIFQGALEAPPFAGFADFLVLGEDGKYVVWDTKLGRKPKPYYLVQLCGYAEMLATITGELPETVGVVLASSQERVRTTGESTDRRIFRTQDFWFYYLQLRSAFLKTMADFTSDLAQRPVPAARADHGRWQSHADHWLTEADHLSQVAGITVGQIKKLEAAGIATLTGLASLGDRATVPKLPEDTLRKLARQARLQAATRTARQAEEFAPAAVELLALAAGERRGLAALPAADDGDVFFDMEGYPLTVGGLEYLFGACYLEGGGLAFIDWWAHDRAEEKRAFESFIDWVIARRRDFPGMHIYHYAAYEVSAVRRLSTAHATREDEVDDLLRGEVFVDLYQLFRQGIAYGEDSYSIKKVEHLYRDRRTTGVATAGDSIVEYARWIASGESPAHTESEILRGIRDYNEDDCRSTADLAAWMRALQTRHGIAWIPRSGAATTEVSAEEEPVADELKAQLLAGASDSAGLLERSDFETLGYLLDFHRREAKPMWWRYFERLTMTPAELADDSACLAMAHRSGDAEAQKKSLAHGYTFDPAEDTKLGAAKTVMFPAQPEGKFALSEFDDKAGSFTLKISVAKLDSVFGGAFPESGSLIPYEFVAAKPIPDGIRRAAARYLAGQHPLLHKLLFRERPLAGGESLVRADETEIEATIRVAREMDGALLCIQGPPGTGKTYTAAHVISSLLTAGKKVGITSNSHKAVINVIRKTAEITGAENLHGIKVGGDGDDSIFTEVPNLAHVPATKDAIGAYAGGIACGTAWLFSREEWDGALDYLFVDEAGQVSLANLVGMSLCARNVLLLGDQMQLEQPIQGSHPGESGLSALQYYLQDHVTIPPETGIFLGQSYRMHPDICRFISEVAYEGRLHSVAATARQSIATAGPLIRRGSGVVFIPIEHDGNTQASDEETAAVENIYRDLLGKSYTDSDGHTRPLAMADFLFVAPYNLQVAKLRAALPTDARIGSVDKFQGLEAPVTILSMCSSFGEYGTRGLTFLLDRNRINVAISRAKCLAIVVGDPRIARTEAANLREMELLNLYCRLVGQQQ